MVLVTVEGLRRKEKDRVARVYRFQKNYPLGCQLSSVFKRIAEKGFTPPYALHCLGYSTNRGILYTDRSVFSLPPPSIELVVVEDKPSDFDAGEINVEDTFIHFANLEKGLPPLHAELGHGTSLVVDDHLEIAFHRTLRMPDDNRLHQLPQSLGYFPLYNVEAFSSRLPDRIVDRGGVFFPMWQREAMWLQFKNKTQERKYAIRINLGKINAVSGLRITEVSKKQDYVVVPGQPWLDGIAIGPGAVRQFIAMPLGKGYTVEGQVTGEEKFGGLQIEVLPSYEGFGKKRFARKSKTGWGPLAEGHTPRFYHLKHGDRLTMTTLDAAPRWRPHQIRDFFAQLIPEKEMTHVTLQAKYSEVSSAGHDGVKGRSKLSLSAQKIVKMVNALPGFIAPSGATKKPKQQTPIQAVQTWQELSGPGDMAMSMSGAVRGTGGPQSKPPTPAPQLYGQYPLSQTQHSAGYGEPLQGYAQSPTWVPQAGHASPPPAPQQPKIRHISKPVYFGSPPQQQQYQVSAPPGLAVAAGQQQPDKPKLAPLKLAAYGSPTPQQPPPSSAPYQSSQTYAYASPPPVAQYHAQPASGESYKNSGIVSSSYVTAAYGSPEPVASSSQPYYPSGSAPQETSPQQPQELPSQQVSTELPSSGNELEQSPSQSPRSEEAFDDTLADAFEFHGAVKPKQKQPAASQQASSLASKASHPTQQAQQPTTTDVKPKVFRWTKPAVTLRRRVSSALSPPPTQLLEPEHQTKLGSSGELGQWPPDPRHDVSPIKYTTRGERGIRRERDEVLRGVRGIPRGTREASRERDEVSRGVREIPRGAREASRERDEVSRGGRGISRGAREVSRERDEVSRGGRRIPRGAREASREQDEVSRGGRGISRGAREVSRERDEISRGGRGVPRGGREVRRERDKVSRGDDHESITSSHISQQAPSGSPQKLNALEAFGASSGSEVTQEETGTEDEELSFGIMPRGSGSVVADGDEEDEDEDESEDVIELEDGEDIQRGGMPSSNVQQFDVMDVVRLSRERPQDEAYKAMELEKMMTEARAAKKAVDERDKKKTLDSIKEKEEEYEARARKSLRATVADASAGDNEITAKEVEAEKARKSEKARLEEIPVGSVKEKEENDFPARERELKQLAREAEEVQASAGASEIAMKEVKARHPRERDAEERARKAEASAGASEASMKMVEARKPKEREEARIEERLASLAKEKDREKARVEERFASLAKEKKEKQPEPPKPKDPQIQSLREMGLAAGGKLIQDIYEDMNPPWIWNTSRSRMLNVHIFDSWTFEAITHIMAPPTPITAEHYTQLGLPFFVIEEEMDQRINGGDALKGVKSVSAMDKKVGLGGEKQQDAAMNKVEPGICKGCSIRLTDCIIRPCNHQLCHACIKQAYTTPVSTNTTTGTTTSSSTTNLSTTNLTPSSSSASDEEIILVGPNSVPQRQPRTHSQPQQQAQGQLNPSAATFRPQSRVDRTPKCPTCYQQIIRVAGFSAPMNIPGEEAFKVDVPVHLLRVGGDGRIAFQSVLQNRL